MTDAKLPSLLIATPCYNEIESLPTYMTKLPRLLSQLESQARVTVLLIDDGSRDGTSPLIDEIAATQPMFEAVHHQGNFGYGAAIKTALCVGARTGVDYVAFVDADSNYDQLDILRLIPHMKPGVDIVNASIFAPTGEWRYPWYRMILSKSCALAYSAVLGSRGSGVYTYTCGFRVYRASIVSRILPHADHFVATAEILTRALRGGHRVVDVPVHNHPRAQGRSKLRTLQVARGHLLFLLKAALGLVGEPDTAERHLVRVGIDPAPTTAEVIITQQY